MNRTATARAHPNIAFIKYWGNADERLRIPSNGSLSMNLDGLYTETRVTWLNDAEHDSLTLNGQPTSGPALDRVSRHVDHLRERLGLTGRVDVQSQNNFPMGAGIASSASSFAALTVAAVAAAGITLPERELSALARLGSGSASRSVPGGYVEWVAGETDQSSYAFSIAGPDHWDLVDVVAVISDAHKDVGSREGHAVAATSEFQSERVSTANGRIDTCRAALLERNFTQLAQVVEHDSDMMHAVMMTSSPPLFYWLPGSLELMAAVRRWRSEGLQVCYTLDAGPNVHCITTSRDADEVERRVQSLVSVHTTLRAGVGGPALVVG
ncbi:MAG: diphosphomevalonate decarboxylase [Chloroflexi bacterium]|nr:diphosphomevalonate decarboxylase [Chloroflexota bacterium]